MNVNGMGKTIVQSHSGETEGYVVLNATGGLWMHRLFPTEEAAKGEIRARFLPVEQFTIAPATQKITWQPSGERK